MTEAEAKTKWCPMVRDGSATKAHLVDGEIEAKCIGSACMMWREHINDVGGKAGFYCGLAGKP